MQLGGRWRNTGLLLTIAVSAYVWAQAGASAAERKIFEFANRERKAQGIPALKWSGPLATAARAHAKEIGPSQPSIPSPAV